MYPLIDLSFDRLIYVFIHLCLFIYLGGHMVKLALKQQLHLFVQLYIDPIHQTIGR